MGEKGKALLESQRVVPNVLKVRGFRFRYDELDEALRDLLG
ncbi:hypothetical protein CSA17_06890 [bacterium DOLJORAL78_65_58]|nr:MAG: hypothetical protein CSA17_06890 [bacterium DOLJORAL78_65_58]